MSKVVTLPDLGVISNTAAVVDNGLLIRQERFQMGISLFFSAMIGYLLGNISSAYLYVRHVMHADIRELGSGNAGATNVNRVLGLGPALRVFILDVLKGVAAVLLGSWLAGSTGGMLAGLAVVAGHDWPVVMGFRVARAWPPRWGSCWPCSRKRSCRSCCFLWLPWRSPALSRWGRWSSACLWRLPPDSGGDDDGCFILRSSGFDGYFPAP